MAPSPAAGFRRQPGRRPNPVDSRALAAIFRGFRRAPFGPPPPIIRVRTMFAVLKTGGKQYRVAKNDVIHVERLPGEAGAQILFDQVLLVGEGANATAGAPLVAGATVAGTLLEQVLADKVIIFKKRRRHNYRRKRGHRQQLSVIRIDEILTDGAKPAAPGRGGQGRSKEQKPWLIRKQAAVRATDATAPAGASASRNSAARIVSPATSSCASAAPSFIRARNVGMGKDHTLFATDRGQGVFHR